MSVLAELRKWHQQGWLRAIDLSLAEYLASKGEPAEVVLLSALVSHQLGRGHPCLDLQQLRHDPAVALQLPPEHASIESRQQCMSVSELLTLVTVDDLAQLQTSAAVAQPHSPLVLQQQRLYLRRYWNYEQQIKRDLAARMAADKGVDPHRLRADLDELFAANDVLSWQRLACALPLSLGVLAPVKPIRLCGCWRYCNGNAMLLNHYASGSQPLPAKLQRACRSRSIKSAATYRLEIKPSCPKRMPKPCIDFWAAGRTAEVFDITVNNR